MLSLGKISAGPQAALYYTVQVAQGRDDYYSGAGEEPGRWVGAGADLLGWRGEVETELFTSLLNGAELRRPPRNGAVAGFDLTFSAPKSLSVLWAISGPEVAAALRAGHDAAVADALAYLEREACRARRGHGGAVQVCGRGFVGAAFMHRTSRAGDPQLHTHVVVGNLTQGPDCRWTALDARHLYRQAKTAGYLYHAVLRRELTERLGLAWTPVQRGVADLAAIPRGVIDHFSQRRAEVLEHMAAHGGRSAASAEIAALETRRGKEHVPLARQQELWRSRAAEHGLTARVLDRALRRVVRAVPLPAPLDPGALTEHVSAFGRPEVLRALAEAQPYGATVADLEQLTDALLRQPEIVALRDKAFGVGLAERSYTTRELLAIEHELIDTARSRRSAGAAQVGRGTVDTACSGRQLSHEQRAMVARLCTGGEGVVVVRAAAGTGKTYALDAAREAWERAGLDVRGCALSARAALELSDQAGIESVTIARLTGRIRRGYTLPRGGVLVVDEAGMAGTRDLHSLAVATAEAGGKLVLVGDDKQLPEIQAGGAFRELAEQTTAIELREVRRQRESWDREALNQLRDGDVERWARAYRARGRITIAANAEEARAALVNDWARDPGTDKVMIAPRREDVRDLNARARDYRQAIGAVGGEELPLAGRAYAEGDRVIGTRNDRHAGILNGQRGTVEAVDVERELLEVRLDTGQCIQLGASYLRPGHLDHGYAITAHRAQGMTVDRSYVLGSEDLYRELGYTALSRHREESRFYLTRTDLDRHRPDLPPTTDPETFAITRMLERSGRKDLATTSLPEQDTEKLATERADIRARLATSRPELRLDHIEQREIDTVARSLEAAREREQLIEDYKQRTRPWQIRERRDLDQLARRARDDQHERQLELEQARSERDARDQVDEHWLRDHRHEIERLLSIDEELIGRDVIEQNADDRLDALDRELVDRARDLDPELVDRVLDARQLAAPDREPPVRDDLDPYVRHRRPKPDIDRAPELGPPDSTDFFDLGP